MSSHALLLRLFLSPSFFSVHVALKYLLLYSDHIGITYYLTRRLRESEIQELYDIWGFICYLLVTRPSKSRALESFVTETASRSTHLALITLWYMQASLCDLFSHRHSPSFVICQRVLHRCHEIIFADRIQPSNLPYANFFLPANRRLQKVKHHVEPVFVGLGILLAATPAMPHLADIMGRVAIEQGRKEEDDENIRSVEMDDSGKVISASSHEEVDEPDSPVSLDDDRQPESLSAPRLPQTRPGNLLIKRSFPGAQTLPALPLHLQTLSKHSEDPFGQSEIPEIVPVPYQSSPSLPSAPTPSLSTPQHADTWLERLNPESQQQLLRGNYFHMEVQFLLNLANICNRLVIVPKLARVSALRAELTALNHKLPAEVCMPIWCSSSGCSEGNNGDLIPHHRIVRIPPGEAVVLNSAERAPYLLYIEILRDDLNFDPANRSNKDILRHMVSKEGKHRESGQLSSLPSFSSRLNTTADTSPRVIYAQTPVNDLPTAVSSPTTFSDTDEEIDLVEQLYGADQPLLSKMLDIEDSIVLPPTPKNRELDMMAWSRSFFSMPLDDTRSQAQYLNLPSVSRTPSSSPVVSAVPPVKSDVSRVLTLDEYSERMRTAAIMLAQLNLDREQSPPADSSPIIGPNEASHSSLLRHSLAKTEAAAIRDRIMKEMLLLEEERMERMASSEGNLIDSMAGESVDSVEDERIIRQELNKVDPSAVVFSELWSSKKSRIRHTSPYGRMANWDCVSVIVKNGDDLRQEQLAVQLIREFQLIWVEEKCSCWVKYFRILITGGSSGLVETITDAVSIHSIKKAEYAKRIAEGKFGHVTLLDHFISTYGEPSTAKFTRAQKNFAKSLAGYSVVTYLLQIKDRHNGNILLDRDGHLVHIDFGFMLGNTPGNIGFEAAPFKFPPEYLEVLGGVNGPAFLEFKALFRQGFEIARKHCDRITTLVEFMQKDSTLPCFAASGDQTAALLRDRFQPTLTHSLIGNYVNKIIDSSLGSHWTRLYDSYQYYSQSIL